MSRVSSSYSAVTFRVSVLENGRIDGRNVEINEDVQSRCKHDFILKEVTAPRSNQCTLKIIHIGQCSCVFIEKTCCMTRQDDYLKYCFSKKIVFLGGG